jgi:hypothetical protein
MAVRSIQLKEAGRAHLAIDLIGIARTCDTMPELRQKDGRTEWEDDGTVHAATSQARHPRLAFLGGFLDDPRSGLVHILTGRFLRLRLIQYEDLLGVVRVFPPELIL